MKITKLFAAALISTSAFFAVSCEKSDDFSGGDNTPVSLLEVLTKSGAEGVTTFALNNICPILEVTDPLTADEIEFLYAMREDEKLARDLYSVFADQYPANIQFSNITSAEANHIAAIEHVFGYYEIEFPASGTPGLFTDKDLQARYDELVQTASALEAFNVMARIEEENIAAYKAVVATVENANIRLLLENIIRASSNHLKAAVRQISILGGEYMPALLDQVTFDEIINSAFGQGNQYQCKYGKGGQGGNTNAQKCEQKQGRKGSVNGTGTCTGTINGASPAIGGQGNVCKGYRGGR